MKSSSRFCRPSVKEGWIKVRASDFMGSPDFRHSSFVKKFVRIFKVYPHLARDVNSSFFIVVIFSKAKGCPHSKRSLLDNFADRLPEQ
ncbi:MAG: hypothetical protein ACHQ51_03440 [Elusimicrobiota bacterium]